MSVKIFNIFIMLGSKWMHYYVSCYNLKESVICRVHIYCEVVCNLDIIVFLDRLNMMLDSISDVLVKRIKGIHQMVGVAVFG